MDIQKKDSSRVLEPDLIVSDGKIVYMSEDEKERLLIQSLSDVAEFLFGKLSLFPFRGGF